MIDEVVVFGVRRAKEKITPGEVQQAVGRAGRSYTRPGEAVVICDTEDESYAKECLEKDAPPVVSEMSSIDEIAFHILPWIGTVVYDESTFEKWYGRTLAFIQGKTTKWSDVYGTLLEYGCIDDECAITPFGSISVKMYFTPSRLVMMKNKFQEVMECGENPYEMIPLSYILSYDKIQLSDVEGWELSSYKNSVFTEGYSFSHGEMMHGYAYKCLMDYQTITPKWIRHVVSQLKDDFPRIMNALCQIAEYCNSDKETIAALNAARISTISKCDRDTASLIYEFNETIGRRGGEELISMGIHTMDDFLLSKEKVLSDGSNSLKKCLCENGFLDEWTGVRLDDAVHGRNLDE